MACYYKVVRVDAVQGDERWLATFADVRDADTFVKSYMNLAKYDECPAGFPVVKILLAIIDERNRKHYTLVRSYYPNAHDCAFVEVLEGGSHVGN